MLKLKSHGKNIRKNINNDKKVNDSYEIVLINNENKLIKL